MADKEGGEFDSVASFIRLYNNLPLEERKRVVLVFESQPISLEVARVEIMNKTPRGNEILKKLIGLKIV